MYVGSQTFLHKILKQNWPPSGVPSFTLGPMFLGFLFKNEKERERKRDIPCTEEKFLVNFSTVAFLNCFPKESLTTAPVR